MDGVARYVRTLVACLLFGGGVLAVSLLIALSLATVRSLYAGDMVTRPGYRTTGTANVLSCEEVGPITQSGFGFWWNCDIVVELADGRSVRTTVGASVVTPQDRGTMVDIVEFCRHPQHHECSYARPGNVVLTLGAGLVRILEIAVIICGAGLSAVALLAGLLGSRMASKLRRKKIRGDGRMAANDDQPFSMEKGPAGTGSTADIPSGFGELIIYFDYPRSGAQVIYETTAPTMLIDGAPPRGEPSWGEFRILVAAGKRKCEVWVPFKALRFGYVGRKVAVAEGTKTFLQYEAPRTPGAPGSLEYVHRRS